ncbi:hypothetical protein [Erwinia amylovora]|nr:hypothetical protein [Erwinia amylovora]
MRKPVRKPSSLLTWPEDPVIGVSVAKGRLNESAHQQIDDDFYQVYE